MEKNFDASVDVVMPLHGELSWIGECLESLASQTVAPGRIIVVDDGIENRASLLTLGQRLFSNRFVLVPNHGRGVAMAINTGVQESNAAWILRMDGDDVCHIERLQSQISFLRSGWPRFIGCGTQARVIDRRGSVLGFQHFPHDADIIAREIYKRNVFLGPTMMVRRDFLVACPFRPELNSCEDYDSALRLRQHGGLTNLPRALLDYRIHPHQQSFERRIRQTAIAEITLRAALRRIRGLTDPIDQNTALIEAFISWRLSAPGYAKLRMTLTALRYASLHFRGKDFVHASRYLLVAARAAASAMPAYHRAWSIVRHGYAGLAREPSPFSELNI